MIPSLRQQFNANFTGQKYEQFLQQLDLRCGTHVKFRNCETPCFFPKSLLETMANYGLELVAQIVDNPEYLSASDKRIPPEFNTPGETAHPLFVQADFGLVEMDDGGLEPRLVEIQGFPSLYAYQTVLAPLYREVYGLDPGLKFLMSGLALEDYLQLLRRAIVDDCDPENVILLEINPQQQKTLPDFLLTERILGISTINITDLIKQGNHLYYRRGNGLIPVHRIYNRVITDELVRTRVSLPFGFRDDLQIEWAEHPNWFFRLSKFSIPYFKHRSVPRTWFLDQVDLLPQDLENYVLKPLFSYAGLGVKIGVSKVDLASIPPEEKRNYILQEKVLFKPVIETPFGLTKAEIRIMYIWLDKLLPVTTVLRMGRGAMMGVDHNRNLEWVGGTTAFFEK